MGRMWGRGDNSKPMPVTLRLETKAGEVLAETTFDIRGRTWTKYTAELVPSETVKDARLVLLAHEQGGICLDMVSLFPQKTFRNRPNGLRADLAQAIADIHPKFVRFPGGCLVHGGGIHQYYDWKDSVGPVEQRKSERNSWGIQSDQRLRVFRVFPVL